MEINTEREVDDVSDNKTEADLSLGEIQVEEANPEVLSRIKVQFCELGQLV